MTIRRRRSRANKYGARKVTIDGITFDSAAEGNYYKYLKLLQRAGEIQGFERQVPFELVPKFKRPETGETSRKMQYIVDFVVTYKDGTERVIDVKGMVTQGFVNKRKLFEYQTGKRLYIAKYDYKSHAFELS